MTILPSTPLFTDGAAYEQLMGRWSRRVGDIFVDWLEAPERLRWLDVGCGTGVFTEQIIAGCAPEAVIGIDPSAEQLAFAAQRPGTNVAEFRVGDAQALPYPGGSFDAAVMALVIHFVPDPLKAVQEMARVLRDGGLGAAYVWDYTQAGSPTAPLAAALKAIGVAPPSPPSPTFTSAAALEELWRSAAFGGVAAKTIEIAVEFADFEQFWTSMTVPVGPAGKAIAGLASDKLNDLRRALEERLSPSADGRIVYAARANAIKGRKGG